MVEVPVEPRFVPVRGSVRREDVTDADREGLEGLVGITFRGVRMFRSRTRNAADCWRCGEEIEPGSPSWRPLGNVMDRFRRLHADCGLAEALEQAGVRR